jgi:hypothetical protein
MARIKEEFAAVADSFYFFQNSGRTAPCAAILQEKQGLIETINRLQRFLGTVVVYHANAAACA